MAESSQTHQYLQEIGRRIKTLRKERGFTLADLGENIGLDKSNTHRLEQGKNFTLLTLIKIAAFLNVHPKDILEVPFKAEFTQIEKPITEKKLARKANDIGKQKSTQAPQSKVKKMYEFKIAKTSIAADSGSKKKRK
jgi:transcriptional regulator with XRE-family HTH domain